MNVLINVGSLLVVLGVLVFVHEFGHFVAAKAAGIFVHRFSLGLGSPIRWLTKKWGETEYSISWLPLGGYVKMATAEEDVTSSPLEGKSDNAGIAPGRMFEAKPVWVRMIVILAGVTMNAVLAFLVFSWVAARNGERIDPVTTVGGVLSDSLPRGAEALAELRPGDRIVAVGGQPVESWNDITERLATAESDSFGVTLSDGRNLMVRIHPAALRERSELLGVIAPQHPTLIERVEAGRPGARAGVQPGDTLLAINGQPATFQIGVLRQIQTNAGVPLQFRLGRAGGPVQLTVTPDSVQEGTRIVGKVGLLLGPAIAYRSRPYTTAEAFVAGWHSTLTASTQIFRTVQGLLSARISSRELGGPIMIAQVAGQAAQAGLDEFLAILGLISVNLAVLNLLPIPVLDGGQFIFLLAEAIIRRPLSLKLRERLTVVGLVLIVLLMVLAFSNDIRRLVGW